MADIPSNTSTNAVLPGSGTYTGSLELNGDSDWWRMSLTGGITYMFKVTGDGSANTLDDAILYLRDSLGNRLYDVYDGYTMSFTPVASGTFYLDVSDIYTDGLAEGNYVISTWMSDTIKNNNTTTSVIPGTGSIAGVLGENTDSDWYRVSLVAGRSYSFAVVGDGSTTSLDDATLNLRDANGNRLDYAYDGYYLNFTAVTGGTYYLDVNDIYTDGLAEGNYVLKSYMNDTIAANTSTTANIKAGQQLFSTVDAAQDRDWFRLATEAGVTYELTLKGTGANGLFDNLLYLMDANGNTVTHDYGSGNGGAVLRFTASSSGPVYLVARSDSNSDGDMGNYVIGVRSSARDVIGTGGNDTLSGMDEANLIIAGDGNDLLYGFGGNDTLRGGAGNDTLAGGTGYDYADFSGGAAANVNLSVNGAQNTGWGMDAIYAVEGLLGGNGNDTFTGDAAGNHLDGAVGADVLNGLAGGDTLVGSWGNDTLNGGAGIDTIMFTPAGAGRSVNLGLTGAQNTGEGMDVIIGVENAIGYVHNDTLIGSSGANRLEGKGGHDLLNGGDGDDVLLGGWGRDTLNGGAGTDTLILEAASGTQVDLMISGQQWTGEGSDTILNIENLFGGNGNDRLFGTNGANVLLGQAGADLLVGRGGADLLNGGFGNDTLRGGDGNDALTGGAGADVFMFFAGDDIDRINDFEQGVDLIEFNSGAEAMTDLVFNQVGANTHIRYGSNVIIVADTYTWQMSSSDFVFS